jgi:hypothetical protein
MNGGATVRWSRGTVGKETSHQTYPAPDQRKFNLVKRLSDIAANIKKKGSWMSIYASGNSRRSPNGANAI